MLKHRKIQIRTTPMKLKLGIFSALLGFSFPGGLALADLSSSEPAISITLPRMSTGVGAGLQTRGYTFSLDNAKTLTHLGIYTWSNEATLTQDRQIGVWDSAGNLVAETVILVGGGEVEGGVDDTFWYGELAAPVNLAPGEIYTAGVWYSVDNAPGIGMMVDFTTIDGFNHLETVETGPPGGAFEKPTIEPPPSRLQPPDEPNARNQNS